MIWIIVLLDWLYTGIVKGMMKIERKYDDRPQTKSKCDEKVI